MSRKHIKSGVFQVVFVFVIVILLFIILLPMSIMAECSILYRQYASALQDWRMQSQSEIQESIPDLGIHNQLNYFAKSNIHAVFNSQSLDKHEAAEESNAKLDDKLRADLEKKAKKFIKVLKEYILLGPFIGEELVRLRNDTLFSRIEQYYDYYGWWKEYSMEDAISLIQRSIFPQLCNSNKNINTIKKEMDEFCKTLFKEELQEFFNWYRKYFNYSVPLCDKAFTEYFDCIAEAIENDQDGEWCMSIILEYIAKTEEFAKSVQPYDDDVFENARFEFASIKLISSDKESGSNDNDRKAVVCFDFYKKGTYKGRWKIPGIYVLQRGVWRLQMPAGFKKLECEECYDKEIISIEATANAENESVLETNKKIDFDVIVTHNNCSKFHYLWNFGDGISSNEKNPTHSYDSPGFYKVTVNAICDYECDEKSDELRLEIKANCDFDNIMVPWELEYIRDQDNLKALLKTDDFKDKIIKDPYSAGFIKLINRVTNDARYECDKPLYSMFPSCNLILPYTLKWDHGHIRIIKNPAIRQKNIDQRFAEDLKGVIVEETSGKIIGEGLTKVFGEAVMRSFNALTFVVTVGEILEKAHKAKELFSYATKNKDHLEYLARKAARKKIIKKLAEEMSRRGGGWGWEYYMQCIYSRAETIRVHNDRVRIERGCIHKDNQWAPN